MKKIVLLLLLVCISCNTASELKTITIPNKYSIDIPENMEKTNNLNDDASLQYQNLIGEFYIIVIDETKESFHNAIVENAVDISTDLEGYYSVVRTNFMESVKGLKVSDEKDTTINGKKAKLFSITGNVQGFDVFYRYAIVEGKSNYYQIMLWTEQSKQKNYTETINKVINSYKEVGTNEKLYKP